MMWSRILAVVVVVAATLWIGSGVFGRTESPANAEQAEAAPAQPLFRVARFPRIVVIAQPSFPCACSSSPRMRSRATADQASQRLRRR